MREIVFTDTQRLFCQGAAGLRVRKPLYGIEQFPFIFSRDDLCYPRMLPSPLDGSAILGTADQQRKPHFSVVSKLTRKANPHIHVWVESHGHIQEICFLLTPFPKHSRRNEARELDVGQIQAVRRRLCTRE